MKTTFDVFMAALGILILAFLGYIFTHQYYGSSYYTTRYYTVQPSQQVQPIQNSPYVYIRQ